MIENYIDKIVQGDCLKVMGDIPDKSIHMIITSPPYNVGREYEVARDDRPREEYLEWTEEWLKESYRVLIDGGRIAVNVPGTIMAGPSSKNAYLLLDYMILMQKVGFENRELITWIKTPKGEIPGKSTSWGSYLSPSCPYLRDASEFIIIMNKASKKRTDKRGPNDITKDEFLQYTSNCWYFSPERDRSHPAPFPEELPRRVIKLYTWEGDIVLDPFVGSGTTAVASFKTNRHFIGIEINPKFVNMAKRRLEMSEERTLFDFSPEPEKENKKSNNILIKEF